MCYYARTDFACGDWRWGNMKERCPRQPRIGETCGAKLVHTESITRSPEECKTCQELNVKRRRQAKIEENIHRWRAEGNRFAASLERAEREFAELTEKIKDLHYRRPSVAMKNNSVPRSSAPPQTSTYTGTTLPSIGSNLNNGYTYTTAPQAYSYSSQYSAYPSTGNTQSRAQNGYATAPSTNSASRNALTYQAAPPRRR